MSFSSDVKKELLVLENKNCCEFALHYALLLFGRAFSSSELSFLTENEEVANAYRQAAETLAGTPLETEISSAGNYRTVIEDRNIIKKIMTALGHHESTAKRRVNFASLTDECCIAAFIRGAFLVSGTVTDPEKEYHLEFTVPTKGLCDDLLKLFDEFEPTPKITTRAGCYVVYFKNSTEIEDVLSIMGATDSSMSVMGTKMMKDVRNTVNRKVNFESANLKRTIAASAKQYDAISLLKNEIGFSELPEELRSIAELRYSDRELSNSEIARMLPESISVSGVNHRFQRLIRMADEIRIKKSKEV